MIPEKELALNYLKTHHVVTLATCGELGPWAAAVFYAEADFTLYFLSSPNSRHSQNIAANPNISAAIQGNTRHWAEIQGIQLEGIARRLSGAEQLRAIKLYGQKFPLVRNLKETPAIAKAFAGIEWYKITPARLYFINNAAGFGHRTAIELLPEQDSP